MKIYMLMKIMGTLYGFVGPFADPEVCGKTRDDFYKQLNHVWETDKRQDMESRFKGIKKEDVVYDCVSSDNPPVLSK
jgi:hypothetical protein